MISDKSKRIDKNSPKHSKHKKDKKKKSSSKQKGDKKSHKRKHMKKEAFQSSWDDSMFYLGKEMNTHFQKVDDIIKNGFRFNKMRHDLANLEIFADLNIQHFEHETPSFLKSEAFSLLGEQFQLFFSHQKSKLLELKKAYKDYLHKNELNFCSKGIYEIYDNLSQLNNDQKLQICFELRDYENSNNNRSIIHEETQNNSRKSGSQQFSASPDQEIRSQRSATSNHPMGDTSFVIKFELLNTDEIHHIWETTDQYVQKNKRIIEMKEATENKISQLNNLIS